MAQPIRELVLAEDWSLIACTDMATHNHLQLQSKDSGALFGPMWVSENIYMCACVSF